MGFVKRQMEEQLELGFVLSTPWLQVCSDCISDPGLRLFVSRHGPLEACDFCGLLEYNGLDVKNLFKYMSGCLRAVWDDPLNGVGWEGEWAGARVIDSRGLLTEVGDPLASQSLVDAFADAFDHEWCQRNPYGLLYHEALAESWEAFSDYVKHTRRYFFLRAGPLEHPDPFGPDVVIDEVLKAIFNANLIRTLPAGTRLFRARAHDPETVPTTARELGSPPPSRTKANRMTPPGISMFYASEDEETALSEVRGADGEIATVAAWITARDLPYLDLVDLPEVPSLFNMTARTLRPWLQFVTRFAEELARPVEPNMAPIAYVPTQVFTEAVRVALTNSDGWPVRAIRYRSSIVEGGVSWIVFVSPDGCAEVTGGWKEPQVWLGLDRSSVHRY